MDQRNGPICHPVWRPISGVIELTPWGQFDDPQPSQRPLLHKISDTPDLRQGVQYYLVMSPQNEMSSLKKFDPELVVKGTPGLGRDGEVIIPLVFILSIISICGGIVALFIENSERRKRRLEQNSP
jgi:hypothetical protein